MNEMNDPALAKEQPRVSPAAPLHTPPRARMWPFLLALVALAAAGAAAWQSGWLTPQAPAASEAPRPGLIREQGRIVVPEASPYRQRIRVQPVGQQDIQRSRSEPGIVEVDPARSFPILPPLGGRVTELKVHLGDHVNQGDPLATIDSGDLAQAYADADKARAQLGLARRALERARGLNQVGGGATKDVEAATNDAAQAEAEFNRTQARLKALGAPSGGAAGGSRTLAILSPANGTVTAINTAQGAYINDATQPIMTVSDLSQVWVTAAVPEQDIGFVSRDQPVTVSFVAYPGHSFPAKVLFVNDLMDPDTRRIKVRIGFPNPGARLKPNMFATVIFEAPVRAVVAVPDSALIMSNDSTTVFVEQAPWTFVRRSVQTGSDQDGRTVIRAGLQPGERIVTSGGVLLND